MELSQIKELWTYPVNDKQANVAAWDSMAERYHNDIPLSDWDSDPFLQQLEKEVPLTKKMSVLDIGCGTGAYSVAIARRVKEVIGIDLSPKMLSRAHDLAEKRGTRNVTFNCADFNDIEIENRFDLVFAHMTPAVADAATFEKMLSCAADYCYMVKPVHRTDPVLDQLKKIVVDHPRPESFDKGMLYAFLMLWQKGKLPTLNYHPAVWDMKKSVDEVSIWYLNRLKTYHTVDEAAEKKVIEYLNAIAKDGIVHEAVHTTIATMGWRMNGE